MELEDLRILFIGGDARFAQAVADLLRAGRPAVEIINVPTADAGYAMLATNVFQLILFELPTAAPPVCFRSLPSPPRRRVCRWWFSARIMTRFFRRGHFQRRQDYLAKEPLDAATLQHAVRCAIERHNERLALIDEKDNYYGIFDHLVEGIFRTTSDGHYLLANVALARIYGYDSPVELMASIKDISRGFMSSRTGARSSFG